MVYYQVKLDLTMPQIKKVMEGGIVHIAPDVSGHGPTFHLTRSQIMKLKEHETHGKGVKMKMSKKQILHNIKRGGGFFDFLKMLGSKIARPFIDIAARRLPGIAGTIAGAVPAGWIGKTAGLLGGFGLRRRRKRY